MNKKETLTVSLSQEELFVLLAHLSLNQLMGLDGSIFKGLTEEQSRLVLTVAERALIARGFLVPNTSNSLELIPTILAITVTCATPDHTLIVTQSQMERPSLAYFFHTTSKLVVGHTTPASGIHQFTVLKDKLALSRSVLSILALGTSRTAPLCPAGQMRETLVAQARDAGHARGLEGALSVLRQSELSAATSEQLAGTLTQPIANTTFVFIDHKGEERSKSEGFTFLEGENGLWLLRPVEDNSLSEDYVFVKSISAEEAKQGLEELIARMGNVLHGGSK